MMSMAEMSHELQLTKANRLQLARAFRHNLRVDYSIDCVIEGQMGRAYTDDLSSPTAYRITIGPFWYFAGDADNPGGRALLSEWPPYNLLMPSPPEWAAAAKAMFGEKLVAFPRYSFAAGDLSEAHLAALLDNSPHREHVVPLDGPLVARLAGSEHGYLDVEDFDSPADFLERSVGFAALAGDAVMGVAYGSLACSRGIEVSLFVEEAYRRQGVATALASRLILTCLRDGRRPNWDAANPESCQLAEKLGFVFTQAYEAYYRQPE